MRVSSILYKRTHGPRKTHPPIQVSTAKRTKRGHVLGEHGNVHSVLALLHATVNAHNDESHSKASEASCKGGAQKRERDTNRESVSESVRE